MISKKTSSTIGVGNNIHSSSFICEDVQDLDTVTWGTVILGNNNVIRDFSAIHVGSSVNAETTIGSGNFIITNCVINHDCSVGDNNIFKWSPYKRALYYHG
jgi:acyl-[acyl carrier protein]--UDP-N-acetylglucosamine O-acyltransferase